MSGSHTTKASFPHVTIEEVVDSHPGAIKIGPFGSQLKKEDMSERGYKVYGQENIIAGDFSLGDRRLSASKFSSLKSCRLFPGDLVVTMMGTIGRCAIFPATAEVGIMDSHLLRIQVNTQIADPEFIALVIAAEDVVGRQIARMSHGSIMSGLSSGIVRNLKIPLPPLSEQRGIAEVYDAADAAIQKTEALIAKLKQIRAGLLHDLLTRGLDEHGQLRDPVAHPEQFTHSPLGRIPGEWNIAPLRELVDSAVDGPFGSNLKTEHYVNEPGVRVVRLQNIGTGYFDDTDKAYVSAAHAARLRRHEVLPGDLLVASLGDDNHPVARACLYPTNAQPSIVKADCFRLRLRPSSAIHSFVMYVLNCPSTRTHINLLGQGVTRDRVNLRSLQQVRVPLPPVTEQTRISAVLEVQDARIRAEEAYCDKLKLLKKGLIHDLLTGRVPVKLAEGGMR